PCQSADAGQQLQDAGTMPAAPILPPMKSIAAGLVSIGNADDLATSQRHEIDMAISVAAARPCRRNEIRKQSLYRVRSLFALDQHDNRIRARGNAVETVHGRRAGGRNNAPATLAYRG